MTTCRLVGHYQLVAGTFVVICILDYKDPLDYTV